MLLMLSSDQIELDFKRFLVPSMKRILAVQLHMDDNQFPSLIRICPQLPMEIVQPIVVDSMATLMVYILDLVLVYFIKTNSVMIEVVRSNLLKYLFKELLVVEYSINKVIKTK